MYKAIILLGLAALASAQVLRISPPVIGSSKPAAQQVIYLFPGGGLGTGVAGATTTQTVRSSSVSSQSAAPARATVGVPVSTSFVQVQPVAVPVRSVVVQPATVAHSFESTSVSHQSGSAIPSVSGSVSLSGADQSSVHSSSSAFRSAHSSANLAAEEESSVITPYGYSFESEDEFGTKIGRQESANEEGVVTGQYTLSDANGIARIVTYIADANGFRASVKTNEPGTLTSNPADVEIESSAAPARR